MMQVLTASTKFIDPRPSDPSPPPAGRFALGFVNPLFAA
jgi:hypothetical protein